MEQDKKPNDAEAEAEAQDSAPRARNRTVLLTPDITGQVRARLAAHEERKGNTATQQAPTGQPKRPGMEAPAGRPRIAAPVTEVAPQPDPTADGIIWAKETPIVGFLVSFDKIPAGESFTLRSGRIVVTSQRPPGGSYLLIQDESISAMHAIMRISESGEILILDQLSEFGTGLIRFDSDEEVTLSGDKAALEHGDIIRFGKRRFSVCILARVERN